MLEGLIQVRVQEEGKEGEVIERDNIRGIEFDDALEHAAEALGVAVALVMAIEGLEDGARRGGLPGEVPEELFRLLLPTPACGEASEGGEHLGLVEGDAHGGAPLELGTGLVAQLAKRAGRDGEAERLELAPRIGGNHLEEALPVAREGMGLGQGDGDGHHPGDVHGQGVGPGDGLLGHAVGVHPGNHLAGIGAARRGRLLEFHEARVGVRVFCAVEDAEVEEFVAEGSAGRESKFLAHRDCTGKVRGLQGVCEEGAQGEEADCRFLSQGAEGSFGPGASRLVIGSEFEGGEIEAEAGIFRVVLEGGDEVAVGE